MDPNFNHSSGSQTPFTREPLPPSSEKQGNWFYRNGKAFIEHLKKHTNEPFWYALALSVFSTVAIVLYNVPLISLAGLIWMVGWLIIFCGVVFINKVLAFFDVKIPAEEKWQNLTKWERFVLRCIRYAQKNPFTAAAIAIAIAHAIIVLHIHAATDELYFFLTFTGRSWISLLFTVGALAAGWVTDFYNRQSKTESRGGFIYLLGFVQFYISFIVFITGLIGGEYAIKAVYTIVRTPWVLATYDFVGVEYQYSLSHTIYLGVGEYTFVFFYILLPLGLAIMSHIDLKTAKSGVRTFLPILALQSIKWVSMLMALIGLFVSWNEGWIGMLVQYVINLLSSIWHGIFG